MYEAVSFTIDSIQYLEGTLYLVFPSGVAWQLIDENFEPYDFTLDEYKVWAVRFWIGTIQIGGTALPKAEFSEDFLASLFECINVPIEGSEEWPFYDPQTDTYILGKDWPYIEGGRKYMLISDGFKDFGHLALILAIAYIIIKFGLIQTAIRFISNAFKWNSTRKQKNMLHEIHDRVMSLQNFTSDSLLQTLDEMKLDIKMLSSAIGVRLIVR